MGNQSSQENFKGKRFLHSIEFMENKLMIFLCDSASIYTFELFLNNKKFRFFSQESISLQDGSIYFIGGRKCHRDQFETGPTANSSLKLVTTDEVYRVNLNKHKRMQIEFSRSKPCNFLPEPRHDHLLLYAAPYIYVIGGQFADFTPARTCLRFHTKTKQWSSIRDFELPASTLVNLSGLCLNDTKLYVFNSNAKPLPEIFQYDIEADIWMQMVINFKNKEMRIPPSINSFVYQIAPHKLLILSGEHLIEQKKQEGYSYVFNIQDEKIEDYRTQRSIDVKIKGQQGTRDYQKEDMIYLNFGRKTAHLFDKQVLLCSRVDVREADILSNRGDSLDFACCSRKKPLYIF